MKNKILTGSLIAAVVVLCYFLIFKKNPSERKTTYQVTDWFAEVPTNISTWDGNGQWVRMVVFKDSVGKKWEVKDGDSVWTKSIISDTFYLLRTADQLAPLRDSAGNPKLDQITHQPYFYITFRNPQAIPKDVVFPLYPIPSRFLPLLYTYAMPPEKIKPQPATKPQDTAKTIPAPVKTPRPIK
jgi:hypothetical protein